MRTEWGKQMSTQAELETSLYHQLYSWLLTSATSSVQHSLVYTLSPPSLLEPSLARHIFINKFMLKFFEMPAAKALHLLRIPVNTLHCLKSSQHSPGIFRWTSENFSISCSTAHNFNTENWNRTCRNCCKTVSGYSDLIILWSPSS